MSETITTNMTVQRNTGEILTSNIGDDLVIMDITQGNYVGLNKIANVIWQQIEKPIRVEDLIQYLMGRYDVQQDECTADTLLCLQKLQEQKLVKLS
jgi:hypothetical protein